MRNINLAASLLATGLAFGCGGAQMKEQKVEDVNASMRAATEVGAEDQPQAALYLPLAQEQTEEAKALAAKGEKKKARQAIDRAQVDADLALQLAQTEIQKAESQEAWNKVEELKRDSQ
jgi:predicted dienelactone hydrolase